MPFSAKFLIYYLLLLTPDSEILREIHVLDLNLTLHNFQVLSLLTQELIFWHSLTHSLKIVFNDPCEILPKILILERRNNLDHILI